VSRRSRPPLNVETGFLYEHRDYAVPEYLAPSLSSKVVSGAPNVVIAPAAPPQTGGFTSSVQIGRMRGWNLSTSAPGAIPMLPRPGACPRSCPMARLALALSYVPCSTRRRLVGVGTFLVPTPSGGCGAQRRSRAALLSAGTGATWTRADPPLGGEHGEHGEDPPLDRSEHRGTHTGPRTPPPTSWPRGPQSRSGIHSPPYALTRAHIRARRFLYRIQVFGGFFAANFNALSCG